MDAERIDRRKLNDELIEVVAKQLHYFENIEKIVHLRTAAEVIEALEGGLDRYRN